MNLPKSNSENQIIDSFPVKNGRTTLGLHLMVDAYGADKTRLNDMKRIYRFLYRLPDLIGMTRLSTPLVVNAEESQSGRDPGGISGIVLITESHISLHTFPKRGFFTFDLYSCNNFESRVDKVLSYLKQNFPYKKVSVQSVKRGLEYPVKNIR